MEELGKANLKKPIYPSSDAVATICYTSVCLFWGVDFHAHV